MKLSIGILMLLSLFSQSSSSCEGSGEEKCYACSPSPGEKSCIEFDAVKDKSEFLVNCDLSSGICGCFINVESSSNNVHVRSCSSITKEEREKHKVGWGCGSKMQKACQCNKNECNLNVETASVGLRLRAGVTPLLIILFILYCRIL